jgi:hypothetical protein
MLGLVDVVFIEMGVGVNQQLRPPNAVHHAAAMRHVTTASPTVTPRSEVVVSPVRDRRDTPRLCPHVRRDLLTNGPVRVYREDDPGVQGLKWPMETLSFVRFTTASTGAYVRGGGVRWRS